MTQIFGLGNAIVDVEVNVEDSFLADQGLPKGQMTLVDSQQVSALTAALDGCFNATLQWRIRCQYYFCRTRFWLANKLYLQGGR